MNTNTEAALEKLVACFDENAELDAMTCIERWRDERDTERLAHIQRIADMAQSAIYILGRVELVKLRTTGDTIVEVPRLVERVRLQYKDIPAFAKAHGLDYKALMDVLELRRLEVSGKGKTWRNGHPSAMYIDRSLQQREHEKLLNVDKGYKGVDMKVPTSYPEPHIVEWRPE